MPKLLAIGVLGVLSAGLGGVQAEAQIVAEMTPEKVREALAQEKGETCFPLKTDTPMGMSSTYLGCYTTPFSRVAQAAQAAKKKYKAFTEADVTPEMIAPHLEVLAPSLDRVGNRAGRANVEAVVIMPKKSKDRAAAIQPLKSEEMTSEYKNLMGATFEGRGMRAVFPLSVLSDANEVHVVFDEKACIVGGWNKLVEDCPAKLNPQKAR